MIFQLIALVAASSFRLATVDYTLTQADGADGKIDLTLTAETAPGTAAPVSVVFKVPTGSNAAVDQTVEFSYADESAKTSTETIEFAENKFHRGIEYTLQVTTKSIEPATITFAATPDPEANAVVIKSAIKSLTEYELTATATTVPAAGAVKVTFTPKAATSNADPTAQEVTFTFDGKAKTATATITVDGAKFFAAQEYTLSIATGFSVTPATMTFADPAIATYKCEYVAATADKKDGATDSIKITVGNELIKAPAASNANETHSLKLTEGTAPNATMNAEYTFDQANTTKKAGFTITDKSAVIQYIWSEAPIPAYTTSKAKTTAVFTQNSNTFKAGELEMVGAKTVASFVAALFAVLAIIF